MPAIAPLPFKPPRLTDLSESLIADHYHEEYGQCVQHLNELEAQIAKLDWSNTNPDALLALHRQRDELANTVTLHEIFFECLGGEDGLGSPAIDPTGPLADAIAKSFGSYSQWKQHFTALANAISGPGWLLMGWHDGQQALALHPIIDGKSIPVGINPIMAIDLFEHSYQADHGKNRSAYIDAFMKNLHWNRPLQRFERALAGSAASVDANGNGPLSVEALAEMIANDNPPVIIDVCLADDLSKRHDTVPDSLFLQAEKMDEWIKDLPKDKPIVAYCMYGFQVSGNAVAELQNQGYDARMLAGGIATWRALGQPTVPLKT